MEGAPGLVFNLGLEVAFFSVLEVAMPTGLKRYYGKSQLHFVNFSCYRRLPLLNTRRARELFVRELDQVRNEMGFGLIGYVVMPNHVHLLMSEPRDGTPSTVLQKLKRRFSQKMRKRRKPFSARQMRLPFERQEEPPRAFWQARFYDFNVYTAWKRREKLNYMHANPVIRRLVKHPKDWPRSSWSFHEKGEVGLIRVDAEGEGKVQRCNPKTQVRNRTWGTPPYPLWWSR